MTNDLYNYAPFFKRIVTRIFESSVAENVFICELRHIFGFVFDEKRDAIETIRELEIFDQCVKEMKAKVPEFECKIIVCGLKAVPHHPEKEIGDY
jgi:adenosine deaminase CECR1